MRLILARIGRLAKDYAVFALLLGALAYLMFRNEPPFAEVACDFAQRPGAPTLRAPAGDPTIARLHVAGTVEPGFDTGLYSFRGTARLDEQGAMAGAVSGLFFLAADGSVDGLSLTVIHPELGPSALRAATLDAQGVLADHRSEAFLYFQSRERRTFPVNYRCRIERR
jgi:hypothetical protein